VAVRYRTVPDVDQPAGQLPVPPTPLALALNNAGQRTQAQGDRSETIEAAWPAGKAATPDELADRIKVHDVTC
jgi:hypothetical protein